MCVKHFLCALTISWDFFSFPNCRSVERSHRATHMRRIPKCDVWISRDLCVMGVREDSQSSMYGRRQMTRNNPTKAHFRMFDFNLVKTGRRPDKGKTKARAQSELWHDNYSVFFHMNSGLR